LVDGADAKARRRRALGRFDSRQGVTLVCGVDEVGRGPLAGPVVAAAGVLAPGARLPGVDDSKRLAPAERLELDGAVRSQARAVGVATVAAPEIDRLNIRQASLLAMRQAVAALALDPELVLVDGRDAIPHLETPQRAIVGGDGRSLAIACASIVAKVHRDQLMVEFDSLYPGYGFARHKGYGSSQHLEALADLGPCPIHRQSFAPVRRLRQGVLL